MSAQWHFFHAVLFSAPGHGLYCLCHLGMQISAYKTHRHTLPPAWPLRYLFPSALPSAFIHYDYPACFKDLFIFILLANALLLCSVQTNFLFAAYKMQWLTQCSWFFDSQVIKVIFIFYLFIFSAECIRCVIYILLFGTTILWKFLEMQRPGSFL